MPEDRQRTDDPDPSRDSRAIGRPRPIEVAREQAGVKHRSEIDLAPRLHVTGGRKRQCGDAGDECHSPRVVFEQGSEDRSTAHDHLLCLTGYKSNPSTRLSHQRWRPVGPRP
ncbi:DUF1163 domain-containing protein [Natrinema altunense]|uniref:DUF1163 domain-containing protein n=1 Tax=Natrinema altunense TaxID=222984 RepID=A0A482Y0H6_9EURY|nr:DUF1163 domain-containing protein [Natrinema altunense]